MELSSLCFFLAALLLSPLLAGVVNRTKARFAGRTGQPLLQAYYDLAKLFAKGAVYSQTTTWVFRAGPLVGLASLAVALTLVPLGGAPPLVAFTGDLVLFLYLLGLLRFFTIAAALDTGSAFEGMGASREAQFSVLTEVVVLASLAALGQLGQMGQTPAAGGGFSLAGIYAPLGPGLWPTGGAVLLLTAAALLAALLAECSRLPVDDPTTHLELTMIHEVMVLDHSGPDLGFILYGAGLKLWILGALVAGVLVPVRIGNPWLDGAAVMAGIFALAVVVGVIESTLARLRLLWVPRFLTGAGVLAGVALLLVLGR
ncbi:MAG: NADH-quinone oxidoreductase subunit H [Deltaproteobacteria bacterium]|nr:NADH-quinone oxidoreductase subunit H [Deltaproteobacteria bacterium]